MMQGPIQNFRGRYALLMMPEDRNCEVLRNTLVKLGVTVALCDSRGSDSRAEEFLALANVVIVDTDTLEAANVAPLAAASLPIIALIGLESPTRLQRALDIEPTAVLMKPVRSTGVFTSLFFAFNEFRRRQQSKEKLASAQERQGARRIVVKAIVHLMQSLNFDDEEAYRYLRRESMSRRTSIEELSAQILAGRRESLQNRKTKA